MLGYTEHHLSMRCCNFCGKRSKQLQKTGQWKCLCLPPPTLCSNDSLPTEAKLSLLIEVICISTLWGYMTLPKPQQSVVGDGKNLRRAVPSSPKGAGWPGVDPALYPLHSPPRDSAVSYWSPWKSKNILFYCYGYPQTCRLQLCSSCKCRYYLMFHLSFLLQPERVMVQVKLQLCSGSLEKHIPLAHNHSGRKGLSAN